MKLVELHEKILCQAIAREVIPTLQFDAERLVEMKCYQTIRRIRQILADDTLDDPNCFQRIEQIVCATEELGLDGAGRHVFG